MSAYDGGLRERIDASKAQLFGVQPHAVAHAEQSLAREAQRTLEQYAVADTLAVDFGKKTLGASANLFGPVFVAALCFNIFHSFPHVKFGAEGGWAQRVLHMPWFLVAFLAFFLSHNEGEVTGHTHTGDRFFAQALHPVVLDQKVQRLKHHRDEHEARRLEQLPGHRAGREVPHGRAWLVGVLDSTPLTEPGGGMLTERYNPPQERPCR